MSRMLFRITAVLALAVLAASTWVWYTSRETLPREIRIASGQPGGLYHAFSTDLATRLRQRTGRPVRVVETAGSEENARLLRDGAVELALIQTSSLTPDGVTGVAPLFPESLHFLARKDSGIRSPADLAGRRVALGLRGSGIRENAGTLLAHYGVSTDGLKDIEDPFGALTATDGVDAALVTTGWMNPTLERVLRSGQVELVALQDPEGLAARHPWLAPTTIPRGLYSGNPPVPPEPVRTVAVTALLSARSDAADELVNVTLAALYESELRASYPLMLTAKAARDYDAAVMHPAVADYHDPSAGLNRVSQAMELASKSKEVLVGLAAVAVLAWGWGRRRRERLAESEAARAKMRSVQEELNEQGPDGPPTLVG
ncbi:MAG TPA: TAXI family TRAP transporter solute-binding subunit, partial [Gemmata sp.]|nr:TAXI family TRAP transporter solute-binding subunit [Gemmata sp.]